MDSIEPDQFVSSREQFKDVSVDLFNVGGCGLWDYVFGSINTSSKTTNNFMKIIFGGKRGAGFTGFWQKLDVTRNAVH